MIDQHKIELFRELFNQANSVLIIYAPDALRDHLFAATALYKTFQELGNKEVLLLSSESLASAETDIVYLDETKTDIGNKNLCISLDYNQDAVEKITSSIDEESKKLHITIKPKKGHKPLSKETVTFSYTGVEADMVILVGVDDLESLEQLYFGYEGLYQQTALVSINSYETSFGNLKMDILGSSSVCEYVTELLKTLNYQLDSEAATNLLAGIDEETEKLESYLATADTFENVAFLLRSGARRFAREDQNESEKGSDENEIYSDLNATNQHEVSHHSFDQYNDEDDKDTDENVLVIEKNQNLETNDGGLLPNNSSVKGLTKKNRRGRPKGSKNKIKVGKTTTNSSSKPGDLNYEPSGLGPSAT